MNIGDERYECPTFGYESTGELSRPQKCRVVRIHPEGRFYVVEFTSEVTGETFRESYYFPERRGNPNAPMRISWEDRDRGQFEDPRRMAARRKLPPKGSTLYQF